MKYYKIVKCFQGGRDEYFATMPSRQKLEKQNKREQLESWGEHTNGGHNYGYTITINRIKKLPKGKKNFLKFDDRLLLKPPQKENRIHWKLSIMFTTENEPLGVVKASQLRQEVTKTLFRCQLLPKKLCKNYFTRLEQQ